MALSRLYNFLAGTLIRPTEVNAELDQIVDAINAAALPPGAVVATAADTPDTGYLLCDGSTKTRATYPALFGRIGTKFNVGGEAGTDFRLPDYQGRMLVMKGAHVDVNDIAKNDGLAVGSRRPKHSHTVNSHNHGSAGAHVHGILTASTGTFSSVSTGGGGIIEVPSGGHIHGGSTDSQGAHTHNSETPGTDAQGAAFHAVNYQIKT